MGGEASPGAVVLLALGIAVGTIAAVFVGGWLYGRYLTVKLKYQTEIMVLHMALTKENWPLFSRWQWRWVPLILLSLVLLFLGLMLFPGSFFFSFLLFWGLSSVFRGLEARELGYVLVNRLFRPMQLLTGEEALHYAERLRRRGIGLLVGWGVLVIVGAVVWLLL